MPDALLGRTLAAIENHPAPSVALVEGPAFGAGCELACACDFRIGGPKAAFCMPPAKLGVVYAPEGLYRIAMLVGRARAKQMFFTGRRIEAADARAFGLLDELADDAAARASALCSEIARNAPLAVRGMKRAFSLLFRPQLEPHERDELQALRKAAFESDDAREGIAAFLEKRAPAFKGR